MSLIAELKRRNVFRVALFYIVAAWVVIQVAETLLPIFDVPDGALRAIVLILVLGFVPAVVFAWAFELTPDGIKRDKDARVDAATRQQTSNKLNWATLIAVVVGVVLLGVDRIVPQSETPEATATGVDVQPAEGATVDTASPEEGVNPASIAVLPFEDLSPSSDQQYFSDGIAEEILNVLVRIDGLEVASRTSAFRFRDREDVGIPGIARELEVRHVLEGSVRKAGETIRVTAQLIDGETDKHLWSETYDRSLTAENLFAIQDEIAGAIVTALEASIELPGVARPEIATRTENLDAYDLFLEARSLYTSRIQMDRADELLARAVELDPAFADAWAIRAAIYMLDSEYQQVGASREVAVERVETFAANALAADPSSALALAVLAFNREIEARDGRAAHAIESIIEDLERAIELDPKNGSARNWLGISYGETGNLDAALEQFRQCAEDDPYNAPCSENYYDTLATMGRMDEALEGFIAALERGAVTLQWVNFSILAHFDMKAHFLFAANLPNYLPGWTRHDEVWAAWKDLEADHSALVRDMIAYVEDRGGPLDRYGGPSMLLAPLGGTDEVIPLSLLGWGPDYAKYRQSESFRGRIRALQVDDYWRRYGFPPQCRPIVTDSGEDDFQCD